MAGTLYIVPTPIGNLGDISQRALDILNSVNFIAAEDTRHSGVLLKHFDINTHTISLHDHNEVNKAPFLIEKIKAGNNIALISDAGTPLISDPGYKLVSKCRENDVDVIALPGPCAFVTALSASGLPTDTFSFMGFLPAKGNLKKEAIKTVLGKHSTHIFYESPRRILSTLKTCEETLLCEHVIVLAKELTKQFETFVSGDATHIVEWLEADVKRQKGEFVLMIYCPKPKSISLPESAKQLLMTLVAELPPKKAAQIVSDHYGLNKKQLYQYYLEQK